MSWGHLLIGLAYWGPLVALLVSSIGIVVLKQVPGLPSWAQRITAPPFYFIPLSFATFLFALETFALPLFASLAGCTFLAACFQSWLGLYLLVALSGFWLWWDPIAAFEYDNEFIGPLVAAAISIFLLRRTLLRETDREDHSNKTKHRLTAWMLFVAFMWAFMTVRFVLLSVVGPSPWPIIL